MIKLKNTITFILTLIGGIWIFIQIVSYFRQPKTDISATIEIIDNTIPFVLLDHFSNIPTYMSKDTLSQIYYFKALNFFSIKPPMIGKLIIRNSGNKEIKEIEIEIVGAYYEYLNNKGEYLSGFSNGNIIMGNLRPTQEINIRLWKLTLDANDIKITYPDGAIVPKEIKRFSGLYAIMATYIPYFWIFIILISCLSIWLFIMFLFVFKIKNINFTSSNIEISK